MVLYNPFTLAFDPSFQLSALATLGLVAFTPIFAAQLAWIPTRFGLREIASSTLGTQTAVLPLLLYQTGNLSIVGLPANILALLPVPIAMFFSIIAAIGGMIFGSYAVPLAYPAYTLLWYIIHVAQFFASLPFAAVSIPAFSAWWMFGAYVLMFGSYYLYQSKRPAGGGPQS
jgi:competence protein ComEC